MKPRYLSVWRTYPPFLPRKGIEALFFMGLEKMEEKFDLESKLIYVDEEPLWYVLKVDERSTNFTTAGCAPSYIRKGRKEDESFLCLQFRVDGWLIEVDFDVNTYEKKRVITSHLIHAIYRLWGMYYEDMFKKRFLDKIKGLL